MNNKFEHPEDYIFFIKILEDHEINSDSGYIELFPVDELQEINKEYQTEELVPNFVTIGTNGGVGMFFSKTNNGIYSISLVGMEVNDAVLLANSFSEFIYKFENDELEIY